MEEGQIRSAVINTESPKNRDTPHNKKQTQPDSIDEIDQEMQKRLIDLHDRMEEDGLHGAVNLIEQLFNDRPGENKAVKQKIKSKIKKVMNTNSNRTVKPSNLNIPVAAPSEETVYRNAIQKRGSSSSEEDGLDLSDESNVLNHLVLGEGRPGDDEVQHERDQTDARPTTSGILDQEISSEEQADKMAILSEKAKASLFPA